MPCDAKVERRARREFQFRFRLVAEGKYLVPDGWGRATRDYTQIRSITMDLGRHPRVFRRWRVERVRGQQPRPENLSAGVKSPRQDTKRNPTAPAKRQVTRRQDDREILE